jgi:cysteine synthase A
LLALTATSVGLVITSNTAERYMSTPLFDGIEVDMNAAELELSRSTPGFRFDAAPPAPPPANRPEPESLPLDAEAEVFVTNVIEHHGVVLFALEWCEFCWAVRKLFSALGIAYKSVDLDSLPFQERDLGTKIRATLQERCASPTIPQIYIGRVHVGGCMDLFEAVSKGQAWQLLDDAGVEFRRNVNVDPYKFLPQWVHPRQSA